jgi:hypothetical protein
MHPMISNPMLRVVVCRWLPEEELVEVPQDTSPAMFT